MNIIDIISVTLVSVLIIFLGYIIVMAIIDTKAGKVK